jgi:serine/threonine protein kinase
MVSESGRLCDWTHRVLNSGPAVVPESRLVDSIHRLPPAEPPDALSRPGMARHAGIAHALPKSGDVVAGKYRIEKVVGEGGMGIVYAAHHLVLDKRVAMKLVLVDALRGEELVERFVREAQAAARLQSEHVVRVTDAGALENGMPFLIMEYLEGCDLAALLDLEGPLAATDVADYMLQALAALAQAHAAGIVHRDLKPANLFLAVRDDGGNLVKVLDFGISKQQPGTARWKELTGKALLGTPAYMSPEQLRSSKSVDARADLWSLGVVMYELLTAKTPFDGDGPGELFAAILETTPAKVRTHRAELPEAWDDVVGRCLARDANDRFQDAAELAVALAPLGSGRVAHLVESIEHACARSVRMLSKTDSALVAAAVKAANTSLPPPRVSPEWERVPKSHATPTFVTDKTIFAGVVPSRPRTPRRRITVGSWAAFAAVLVVAVAAFAGRGSFRASPTSAQPPLAAAASAPAEEPEAGVAAPRAPDPPPPPTALAAATSEPKEDAPPAPVLAVKPVPASPAARKSSAATKPKTVESRPQFLKSWR